MVLKDGMVAGSVGAENEPGAWTDFDPQRELADAQAAIGADLESGALAPNKRPPGTSWNWT